MSGPDQRPLRRTPASRRAEEFLRRVLPGPDAPDPVVAAPPVGVDDRTQARLEAMGDPDRESW